MHSELHEVDEIDDWEHFPDTSHHFSLLQTLIYYFSLVYMYVAGASKQHAQLRQHHEPQ